MYTGWQQSLASTGLTVTGLEFWQGISTFYLFEKKQFQMSREIISIHQTRRVIAKGDHKHGFDGYNTRILHSEATSVSSNITSILEEGLTLEVIRGMRSMRCESLAKPKQEVVGGFIVPRPQS
jgi:hypothetical protein